MGAGRSGGIARWLALLALLLVAPACLPSAPPSGPATPTPIGLGGGVQASPTPGALRYRIAVTQPTQVSGYLLPYWVGYEAGIFRQEGLAVELVALQSEQLAVSAASNGDVDLVVTPVSPPMLASAAATDLIILGATHNAFDQRLITVAEVTSRDDLIGKAAVLNARGTLNEFQTREALLRVGIEPETQFGGYLVGANQPERVQHLKMGNAQALTASPPVSTALVKEGFVDFGDLSEGAPWPGVAIWASKRVYTSRYAYAERFMRGLLASIARTKSDPEAARQAIAKYTELTDPDGLNEAYEVYGDRLLERVPRMSREGLQRAIDFMAQTRLAGTGPNPNTLIEQALIERLATSGLLEQLYR